MRKIQLCIGLMLMSFMTVHGQQVLTLDSQLCFGTAQQQAGKCSATEQRHGLLHSQVGTHKIPA